MKFASRRRIMIPAILMVAGLTLLLWPRLAVQYHKLAMRWWDNQADWAAWSKHQQALLVQCLITDFTNC